MRKSGKIFFLWNKYAKGPVSWGNGEKWYAALFLVSCQSF